MEGAEKPVYSKLFVTICLLLNIALSISIVMLNKTIYTYYGFPNISMTCIHFIFTSIGMLILRASGQFVPKTLPLSKMLPISMTFCGFVVFTNLSLQTNTVGTYQIIKTMTTPGIMIIQTYFYNRSFSIPVRCTLVRTVASQSEEGGPMNLPSVLCPSVHLVPLPLPDHHTIYLPPMRMIRDWSFNIGGGGGLGRNF